jgi:hypothetical protein
MRIHTLNPAYTVIKSFEKAGEDGLTRVARIVGRSRDAVRRWTYPKESCGTGGGIPRKHYQALLAAAVSDGVPLTLDQLVKQGDAER